MGVQSVALTIGARDPARQVWPLAENIPASTPLTARSRSASSKTILGDFPPSSSETRANRSAALSATCLPTVVDPVKATLSTSGWAARAARSEEHPSEL